MAKVFKFNIGVYMPEPVRKNIPSGIIHINWTYHALNEAVKDDFDHAEDYALDMRQLDVVEVECNAHLGISKMVVRAPYDNERDMVLVLVKKVGFWSVVSCWSNRVNDKHTTLRTANCVPPPSLVMA